MTKEQRRRSRTNLHTQVFLYCPASDAMVEGRTDNVSMDGFYCRLSRAFAPGEHLRFLLRLSPQGADFQSAQPVYLDGVGEVVHVAASAAGSMFGVGLRVDSYHILPQSTVDSSSDIKQLFATPYPPQPERARSTFVSSSAD